MIGTSFHQRNTRNIPAHKITNSIIILILSISFSIFPQKGETEEYQVPQYIIDLCIISSPFVAAGQLVSASRLGSENPVQTAKSARSLYSLLTGSVLTPEACRSELPRAIADLDRFMFLQSLKLCSDAEISALGTDYARGGWYCNTMDAADWRQFREWLPTDEGQAWLEERTGLTTQDVFVPLPVFDASKHIGPPKALNGWYEVGAGGAISNDIGFRLTAVCEGNATLILAGEAYGGARANLGHDNRLLLYATDPQGSVIDSVQLPWISHPGSTSVEIPLTMKALKLLRLGSEVGIDSDPFGVSFSLSGASKVLTRCKAQEVRIPDLASSPLEVVKILKQHHAEFDTCVDVGLRPSFELFGNNQRNKSVRDFCNPKENHALINALQPCGITNFGRDSRTHAFFEYLQKEGIIAQSEKIFGNIVTRIHSGNNSGSVSNVYINRNNTMCGRFQEIEYEVRLRDMRTIGEGYLSVEYSVRQYSANSAVAGVLFTHWNPTLTRTLIYDVSTSSWTVSD